MVLYEKTIKKTSFNLNSTGHANDHQKVTRTNPGKEIRTDI